MSKFRIAVAVVATSTTIASRCTFFAEKIGGITPINEAMSVDGKPLPQVAAQRCDELRMWRDIYSNYHSTSGPW